MLLVVIVGILGLERNVWRHWCDDVRYTPRSLAYIHLHTLRNLQSPTYRHIAISNTTGQRQCQTWAGVDPGLARQTEWIMSLI